MSCFIESNDFSLKCMFQLAANSAAHTMNGYSIISVDGSTTAANWKFEIANTAGSFATSELHAKASAGFDYEMQPSYVVILE